MNIIRIGLLLWISLLLNCSEPNPPVLKIDRAVSGNAFSDRIDSFVAQKMDQYQIPGLSIGIVKNDTIVYEKGFGVKDIDSEEKVTSNSIFHVASISKLFTAMAIMNMEDQGSLKLVDKITEIIPELQYKDDRVRAISIKHLLNSTSGLPDIGNYHWEYNHQSDESLANYIKGLDLKLDNKPGLVYSYSNLGYNILGYVIEKRSASLFEDFLEQNILRPSGMLSSDFRYFKIAEDLRVAPHTKHWLTGGIHKRKTYPYTREHAPSSTLNSSAKDLNQWMIYFFQNIEEYSKMMEPSFPAYPHIGLGFQLYDFDDTEAVGHYGGDKGFRSFLMMIPEQKIGLVLLANCDYNEDFRQEIIHPIAKLVMAN